MGLPVCMYANCMYSCMYALHACVLVGLLHTCACACTYMCTHMYVPILHMHAHIHTCAYVYVYSHVHAHVDTFILMHTHTIHTCRWARGDHLAAGRLRGRCYASSVRVSQLSVIALQLSQHQPHPCLHLSPRTAVLAPCVHPVIPILPGRPPSTLTGNPLH